VLARSVYSDIVFVDALMKMGWLTENCEHSAVFIVYPQPFELYDTVSQ